MKTWHILDVENEFLYIAKFSSKKKIGSEKSVQIKIYSYSIIWLKILAIFR